MRIRGKAATLCGKVPLVEEPRKTRYAGFVIVAALLFGLIIVGSQEYGESQILGAVLLCLGAMVVWTIVRGIRANEDRQAAERRSSEIDGRLGAIEQQLGTRLRQLEETVAQMKAATASQPFRAPGTELASGVKAAEPEKPAPVSAPSPAPPSIPPEAPPTRPTAGPFDERGYFRSTTIPPETPPRHPTPPPGTSSPALPAPLPTPAEATAAKLAEKGVQELGPITLPSVPGAKRARSLRAQIPDFEEMLGTNWLSKLGITGLVLGIAFLVALEATTPGRRVALGYVSGAAMLAAGIYFERAERYRLLARVGIAGGWPLIFFVTYAMHHVEAARIAGVSLVGDLVLMLIVAGAMVGHTLRYRSQMVTGLGLLLAFLTIAVSRDPKHGVESLTASVVLAMAVAVLSVRMKWYELEVFGILATYLNHYWWLVPIVAPMQRPLKPFPQFLPSIIFLILYWAVFRASYVLREPPADERISSVACILSPFLLLALAKYQSAHPELAWKFLLAVGAVEFALGQIPFVRRRRAAFVLLSTIGVTLIFTSIPLHFSPENTSLLWLALAESLFFSGVFLREIVFRRLGYIASAVAAIQLLAVHTAGVVGERMDHATYALHVPLGFTCAIAAALLLFTAHIAPRGWRELFPERWDEFACYVLSWLAAAVAAAGIYVAFPYAWIAVVWIAVGVLLLWASRRWTEFQFATEAYAAIGVALLRALVVNLEVKGSALAGVPGVSLRLVTLAAVGALCYAASRWGQFEGQAWTEFLPSVLSTAGTGVAALVAWYELQPASVALAWALVAIALVEVGLAKKWLGLRLQAYAMFAGSFLRLFFVNLNAEETAGASSWLSPRLYTVVPLVVVFYFVYERLRNGTEEFLAQDRRWRAAEAHCWMGLVTAVALVRFEAPIDWVVAAWAVLALLLLFAATLTGRRLFLSQCLVLGLAVAVRGVLHNFYERSYFSLSAPFWYGRAVILSVTAAVLLAGLPLAYRLRVRGAQTPAAGRVRRGWFHFVNRPEQTLFFVALLLVTALLAAELKKGMVTMGWGLEAVVVFLFALKIGERSFRLAGLALLLLCVAKIPIIDIWDMTKLERALTFVVLGASMLGVSYLYTRYRERVRQFL